MTIKQTDSRVQNLALLLLIWKLPCQNILKIASKRMQVSQNAEELQRSAKNFERRAE